MNFDFSEDQKLLQSEVQKFLRDRCPTAEVRTVLDSPERCYHEDLWRQIVDLGWTSTAIPEEFGGMGLGYLELCVIAEELGRYLTPVPFSSTVYLFAETIKLAGNAVQQGHYLSRVAAGETIACLALAEELGSTLTMSTACRLVDGRLSGSKIAVADGDIADTAVVVAVDASSGAESLYLVDLEQDAVERCSVVTLDPSRSHGNIRFDSADCELLGETGKGREILSQVYDIAAVLFAFEQLGGCEAALAMGIEYTSNRYAFGRSVASFQAIKHKFADMFVAKELARSNAYYGAWALSSAAPELPLAAATARVSAIDAYRECSKENVQAHGGMGFTWEFDCQLYYRRAQQLALTLGSEKFWKQRLADVLLEAAPSAA